MAVEQLFGNATFEAKIVNPLLERLGGVPKRATEGSGALDLVACIEEPVTLRPQEVRKIPSGLSVWIANPHVGGFILPRSGLGTNAGLVLANTIGLIDSDYQGEIILSAFNRNPVGGSDVVIRPGERIFQMVFLPLVLGRLTFVDEYSGSTERTGAGFGSTGT